MENKYRIKRLSSSNNYIKLNGVSFYKHTWESSCSLNEFNDIIKSSKNKLDINALRQEVLRGRFDSPFNRRPLKISDYIVFSNKKIEGEVNIGISKNLDFFGFFGEKSNSFIVDIVLSVLTKYKNEFPKSTWQFISQENKKNRSYCDIFISSPHKREEYTTISNIFAEIAEAIKVLVGYKCIVNIILPKNSPRFKQKEYSATLLIPVAASIALGKFVLNKVSESLVKSMTEGNTYSRDTEKRLLSWAFKKKDLLVTNIGDSSFYVDRGYYESNPRAREALMKNGNSENPRTSTDYLKLAISQDKDLVVYSDANSSVVLAHELGHYIVSRKKFLRKLQNSQLWRTLSRSDRFISFIAILLGLTGNVVAGVLSTLLMKCPVLISEFAASYYGLKIMKEVGCSKGDIEKAKSDFRKAYMTYMNGALGMSLTSVWAGSLGKVAELPTEMPELI